MSVDEFKLSPQQHSFFDNFGFLAFPGLLADRIEEITEAFEELWSARGGGHHGQPHDHEHRSCIVPFIDSSAILSSLLDDPQILGITTSLLGDDFNYMGSDGNLYTGDTGWHSDGRHEETLHIKIAFYLDPVTRDTGCLRVIPGSHRLGDTYADSLQEQVRNSAESWDIGGPDVPAMALETQPGDIVCFNHNTKHAAFGGSTNLLLHIPAVAHAAGIERPTVNDWSEINRRVPRLVSVLPNGPVPHPTVRVFLAGGVPEVMLYLRDLGLLNLECLTATGEPLGKMLDWWAGSERRTRFRQLLQERDGVDPDEVIMSPDRAEQNGLTSTVTFPIGNLAPEGSVIKSTAIDPSVVGDDGVYRKVGPARVFTTEKAAIAAIKSQENDAIKAGDVLVLICRGPMGAGMEETYQITSALKHIPWGKEVAIVTDARFSGVSTGACIGHVGPEALAGGPIGKVLDGDLIQIIIDRNKLEGRIDLVGHGENQFGVEEGTKELECRPPRPDLAPDPDLPDDTRLWAALQRVSGGTWGGCVFDVDAVIEAMRET